MAKTKIIVGSTKVEKAPAKFAEKGVKEKFLTVLETVKGLEVQTAQGKNNKAYKEFISLIEEAVKLENFDIDQNGKLMVNMIAPENRDKAQEIVNLLDSDNIKSITDLNNPDLLLDELKLIASTQEGLASTNKGLNEKNEKLEESNKALDKEIKDLKNRISVFESNVTEAEKVLVRISGKDIKDIQEEVKDHNLKNPKDQVTTLVYLAREVDKQINNLYTEIANSKNSNTEKVKNKKGLLNKLLTIALVLTALGAGYHAVRQIQVEDELNHVLNIYDDQNMAYAQKLLEDGGILSVKADDKMFQIDYDKDGKVTSYDIVFAVSDYVMDNKNQQIEKKDERIQELEDFESKFNTIKDALQQEGYSYITDYSMDLDGLIDDLNNNVYFKETQDAYNEFVSLLQHHGIEIDEIMENGQYKPELVKDSIEPIITASINYLNNLVSLDEKLDNVFDDLELEDANGNPITFNTFENRQAAYDHIINYVSNVYELSAQTLEKLDSNTDITTLKNADEIIRKIDEEVVSIKEALEESKAKYDELKVEKDQLEEKYNNTSEACDLLSEALIKLQAKYDALVLNGTDASKAEIESLKAEVGELKTKIETLNTENEELLAEIETLEDKVAELSGTQGSHETTGKVEEKDPSNNQTVNNGDKEQSDDIYNGDKGSDNGAGLENKDQEDENGL